MKLTFSSAISAFGAEAKAKLSNPAIVNLKTAEYPFVLQQLKEKFREEDTMGGGTIFKSVSKADMHWIEALWPADLIRARFNRYVAPMFRELENLDVEELKPSPNPRPPAAKFDVWRDCSEMNGKHVVK